MRRVDRILTRRLVLRRWTEADKSAFAALNADSEVMRYFPATLDPAQSDAMVDRIESSFEAEGFGLWAVEVDERLAGFTGLNRTAFETPMGAHVEIGWRLATWAWHRGLATEAALATLDDGFTRCGLAEVFSFTTTTNTASERVMQRIGMTRRTDLDFDHPRTPGWWGQRHLVYRITAAECASRPR